MTTTARPDLEQQPIDVPTAPQPAPRLRTRLAKLAQRPPFVVSLCASIAAVWSIVGSRVFFPLLTNDHDEAVYLLQANAIEHGHLFPRAGLDPDAFLPWLSAQEGHRFVPKYAPVFPTILAAAKWVFGTERAALPFIAAGVIVMTYFLASEIVEDKRYAALASAFMLLTPLFIVQSATFLPYTTSLLLLTSFGYCFLHGLRVERGRWLTAAGFFLGFAFFSRPYDALLFMAPLAIYAIVRYRRDIKAMFSRGAWVVLGLIPPGIAMLVFNHAATGSSLSSPFSLIDSRDTIGFGVRSMNPGATGLDYTVGLGWTGLSRHTLLTMFWCFGGLVLIGCAIYYLTRTRFHGLRAWLGLIAISLPLGYLFFWGTYGAAVWGAPWYLGPYYYMPIFAPIVILGTGGFVFFYREYRKLAIWGLVGMIALSAFVVGKAMTENWNFTQDDHHLYSGFHNLHLHNAIVFLPGFYGPRVLHPYAKLSNNWNTTGNVLYAVDRGDAENLPVILDYGARAPYQVFVEGNYRANPPDPHLRSTVKAIALTRGHSVSLTFDFENPTKDPVVTVSVTLLGRVDRFVLDTHARRGSHERVSLVVTPDSTTASGASVTHTRNAAANVGLFQVEIGSAHSANAKPNSFYFRSAAVALRDGEMVFILPGQEINGFLPPKAVQLAVR